MVSEQQSKQTRLSSRSHIAWYPLALITNGSILTHSNEKMEAK